MRPQFYPWLFDDRNAWEKSLTSSHYSYELPIDSFMSLYCPERKETPEGRQAMSAIPMMPVMSAIPAPIAMPVGADASSSVFGTHEHPAAVAAAVPAKEEKKEEGILSQDDIDALLAGL